MINKDNPIHEYKPRSDEKLKKTYFEGRYYKSQNKNQTVALIPAKHVDINGKQSASIQLITDQGAFCTWHPYHEFQSLQNHI